MCSEYIPDSILNTLSFHAKKYCIEGSFERNEYDDKLNLNRSIKISAVKSIKYTQQFYMLACVLRGMRGLVLKKRLQA